MSESAKNFTFSRRDGRDTANSVDQFLRKEPPSPETMGMLGLLDAAKISKAQEKMAEFNKKSAKTPLTERFYSAIPYYIFSGAGALVGDHLNILNSLDRPERVIIGAVVGLVAARFLDNFLNGPIDAYKMIDSGDE